MASLRGFLPSAGGTVWRNDRRMTSTSSSGEAEYSLSRTRIKHIVVREVWKKTVPSPHAVYKIDVMTQSNHWFIFRRYREFHSLHQNLVKQYGIPSDMFPSKKFSSNMSLGHLDNRRNALEHYLQRLINSHHDVAESKELFQFLNVETHDVLCVTRQLAAALEREGRNILASGSMFTLTPTQMYCITRQLQLPHFAVEQADVEELADLGYLYGFIQELKSLCVSGIARRSSPSQELISNQAFDISHFKSLQKLQIEKCHICVIDGLYRIQKQLTHVTLRNSSQTMKEFLVDCVMQKRAINQANSSVESWRNVSTTKLTENRVVVRPWLLLTHVNMSHNKISTLDHSLKLLPALEQLDLSYNEFVHLDLKQLTSSTLTFLNISHNEIHYISSTTKDLRNLKSLLLNHNKLQNLDGLSCLRGLIELDVRDNELKIIEELAKISSLLHMRILALTGNPCASSKSHRIQVFSQLKSRELILDGIKITESEKVKVQQQERKTIVQVAENPECSSPSVQQNNTVDLKGKNAETDRDDDQDSGFGGNYGGSVDDGNLVFDWNCYRNYVEMPTTFKHPRSPYVAGPTSPAQYRGALTLQVKQSNNVVVQEKDLNLSDTAHATKSRRLDKGKTPLKVSRLRQKEKTSPKLPTSEEYGPKIMPYKQPEVDRDRLGAVGSVERLLESGEAERHLKAGGFGAVELTSSDRNCCMNNSESIGKLPSVTNSNSCEKLSLVTEVGGQSKAVTCDVSGNSSVVRNSSLSTDCIGKHFVVTEDPLPNTVSDPSTSKKSLVEESSVSTQITKCSLVAGQSVVPNEFLFSPDQTSFPTDHEEDEIKSSSVTKDSVPSFLPENDTKSCSVDSESSNSANEIKQISSSLDGATSTGVCHDESEYSLGEKSLVSAVNIDNAGMSSSLVRQFSPVSVCSANKESSVARRDSSTSQCITEARSCIDSERSSKLVNGDINVFPPPIENEKAESLSISPSDNYSNVCSIADASSSNSVKDIE